MFHKINSKYLVFPVNLVSARKVLTFKCDNDSSYSLNIRLDNINPNFYAYIDVSRYMGKTVEISCSHEMNISFSAANEIDNENLYIEELRPQIHFSTKNGWLNDPNGLVYLDGTYHLFYQYNPAESVWENMHWGHAVSSDLIHWEEKDIALFPDERGTMYSGCAFVDKENKTGLKEGETDPVLLYYTTTNPFCQQLSYSTDNFRTIKRYKDEPVVPNILDANRDPAVIYCEELGSYIMALYLTKNLFCILKSDNLIDWTEIQRIDMQQDNECPDIFPLTTAEGERKWIFIGAWDRYLVGSFKDGLFQIEQPLQFYHYGQSGYAGQSFSNLPDNRTIRLHWDRWGLPAPKFNGQMGIPMEMGLEKYEGKYYLTAKPVKELETLYRNTSVYDNVNITAGNSSKFDLEASPYLLKIKCKYYDKGSIILNIFGNNIELNFDSGVLRIGESDSPLSITKNGIDMTVVIDKTSREVYADGGKLLTTVINQYTYCDYNLPYLLISSTENVEIESLELTSLDSIWK